VHQRPVCAADIDSDRIGRGVKHPGDLAADNQVVGVEILNLSKRSPKLNLRELEFQAD
jgi:hypothetical protein